MLRRCILRWCFATAGLLLTHGAGAQEVTLLRFKGDRFVERFEGKMPVRVHGNFLAGVSLGGKDGSFRPNDLRVVLAPAPASGGLCVGIASRDGRYSAENLYPVASSSSRVGVLEFRTRFPHDIASYGPDSMAVLIRDVPSCTSAALGTILPSIDPVESLDWLRVFLNAPPERTTVKLLAGNVEIGTPGRCNADRERTSVAFAATCVVGLPTDWKGGQHQLVITVRERMAPDVSRFNILLQRP